MQIDHHAEYVTPSNNNMQRSYWLYSTWTNILQCTNHDPKKWQKFKFINHYYSKGHIIIHLASKQTRFEHSYSLILAAFCSSSCSSPSRVSLVAQSCLPCCSESIQNIQLSQTFGFGEESEVARGQILGIKWKRTHHNVFTSLPFHEMACPSTIRCSVYQTS